MRANTMTDEEYSLALEKARQEGRAEGVQDAESREQRNLQLEFIIRFCLGCVIGGICAAASGAHVCGIVVTSLIVGVVFAVGFTTFLVLCIAGC